MSRIELIKSISDELGIDPEITALAVDATLVGLTNIMGRNREDVSSAESDDAESEVAPFYHISVAVHPDLTLRPGAPPTSRICVTIPGNPLRHPPQPPITICFNSPTAKAPLRHPPQPPIVPAPHSPPPPEKTSALIKYVVDVSGVEEEAGIIVAAVSQFLIEAALAAGLRFSFV